MKMPELTFEIRRYLRSRGISAEDVTLTVVLPTENDTFEAEMYLKADYDPVYGMLHNPKHDWRKGTFNGIKYEFKAKDKR